MNQKHYLLSGTFWLTFAGILTRIAGFFYKIFLSRTIGAAEIGLFQLTMPVYAFCMAFACGGIQTAVSRFTAEYHAKNEKKSAFLLLIASLLLSGGLALFCSLILYVNAELIAERFLLEVRCVELLRILAMSLPFCVIHSCLGGYFIGRKNIMPSALSQLIEQMFRIGCAFFYYAVFTGNGRVMDASVMALGQLFGELASAVYCFLYLFLGCVNRIPDVSPENTLAAPSANPRTNQTKQSSASSKTNPSVHRSIDSDDCFGKKTAAFSHRKYAGSPHKSLLHYVHLLAHSARKTMSVSVPLGLNRMLLCVLQGMEAALLPQMLQQFGHSGSQALSVYGTLTGMSLPLLMFPTAVTGALGTLLLPSVSEARTLNHKKQISATTNACFYGSLLLGILFFTAFFLFGKPIGNLLFESRLAGAYIRHLALVCPFLYLNTTMTSIIHGLGKSTAVFLWNIAGFAIRLASVVFFVPQFGIEAYLWGVIGSQLFISICTVILLMARRCLTFEVPELLPKMRHG